MKIGDKVIITGGTQKEMIQEIINKIEREIELRKNMPHNHEQVDICYGLIRARDIISTISKPDWIPVAERLPDKPGDYWVAMRHLDGSVTTVKMFWSPDWPHEDAWNEVVVAWQPYYYPEPFVPQN